MTDIIKEATKEYIKEIPDFKPGDTIKVYVNITEGDKKRIQVFEGIVISRRGSGVSESFTVRKISFGVGVERTFPIYCPTIDKIEIVKRGVVRRAKLYYIRKLQGKALRIKEKR